MGTAIYDPPSEVLNQFIDKGWAPGRSLDVPHNIPSDHPAFEVLKRYAKLTIGECGKGIEVATSDIEFRFPESDNPEDYEKKSIWEKLLNTKLISVAHVHQQHGELFVGSDGRCFGRSYIHDAMWLEGETFAIAVKNILTGIRAKPMLRPNQKSVSLYGVEYTRKSAEIYDWDVKF